MILRREDIYTEFGCDFGGCTRTIKMWRGMTGTVRERWGGARIEGWTGPTDGEHGHRCPIHGEPEAA